ncbi:MAG: adenylosuccinate synthase [Methanobacteriota archaeon]|nr:MAG: adenylosuccinate synthase [Euryarchaeota archaeon]
MPTLAVIGTQWGDEGKGKVVDYLAGEADVVVRFQGGNNAGHSVKIGEELFKLHHLPSGILRPGKLAVIGNGVVIDPGVILKEIEDIQARGKGADNLRISDRAHVIMPYHKLLDGAEERLREGAKVGTTGRGIGPAYADKAARLGVRMGELVDEPLLRNRMDFLVPLKNKMLEALGSDQRVDGKKAFEDYAGYGRSLKPFITDTGSMISEALSKGRKVLFEGAQGTMLDIDHGTYPYVTSSSTISANAAAGAGIPPTAMGAIIGVVKAYTTRVGAGPLPTELHDETGERIAEKGGEFGTTTGRTRRCGWLDLAVLRYSHSLNGFTGLALTKVDVLGGLDEVKVCTHYTVDGKRLSSFPPDMRTLERVVPVYRSFDGWDDLEPARLEDFLNGGLARLPRSMRYYVGFLEKEIGVPVHLLGLGRRRSELLDLRRERW